MKLVVALIKEVMTLKKKHKQMVSVIELRPCELFDKETFEHMKKYSAKNTFQLSDSRFFLI